jgi:arylsulfatase A-like enzyme
MSLIRAAVFAACAIAGFFPHSSADEPVRPNIIFILTDDQRWDALGAMGNPIVQTPHLDALAKKGILFQNARVTTSICCVSRASLLSGQYESRHKINDFTTNFSEAALAKTYPALLKNAGYRVGFVGKLGVGREPPQIFDVMKVGEEERYWLTDAEGKRIHHTDLVGQEAGGFLDRFAGKKEPFYLSIGFKAPHELDGEPPKYPVQERFAKLYDDVIIPVPLTAEPKYWGSFPDFFRTEQNLGRHRWHGLFGTPELFQENVKNYYRLITGVDDVVGQLMGKLEKLGVAENTVIVFMGDNGFFLGEHGMEGKWFGYEESLRVPLFIYDPRAPEAERGKRSATMALNIDIAPTILHLAGIAAPESMQGYDLVDVVNGKREARQSFFYEHTYMGSPGLPKVEGVVMPDLKYMKYIEHGYEELYDLKNDPHETVNLAGDPAFSQALEGMRKKYTELKEAAK